MNQNYIFSKDSNREYLFYIAVIPLILYGIYKNSYLLYKGDYITLFNAIKIILYPIISTLLGFLVGLFKKDKKPELIKFGIIAGLAAPFDFNMIAYFSIVVGCLFMVAIIPNRIRINEAALFICILVLLNRIYNNSIIFNPMEINNTYKFTLFDLFFGRGASFLFTSSIFWLLISYICLIFIKTYKKNIFFISSLVLLFLSIIYMFITKNFNEGIKILLNGSTFFSLIFIAPINESSPSIQKEIIMYSVLLGIFTFIFVYLFKIYNGAIISVLILSIIYRAFDIIKQKKFLKKI